MVAGCRVPTRADTHRNLRGFSRNGARSGLLHSVGFRSLRRVVDRCRRCRLFVGGELLAGARARLLGRAPRQSGSAALGLLCCRGPRRCVGTGIGGLRDASRSPETPATPIGILLSAMSPDTVLPSAEEGAGPSRIRANAGPTTDDHPRPRWTAGSAAFAGRVWLSSGEGCALARRPRAERRLSRPDGLAAAARR
jgi:hypothetical protein